MSIEWNCIYCGTVNPENDRFCKGCHSRFPNWQERFFSHVAGLRGEKKPTIPPPSSTETPFVIPRPGEIIGGFFRFTEEVLSGQISPDSFKFKLEEASELIRSVFQTMYQELGEISEAGEEYGNSMTKLLEFVHFMFNMSIQEMMLYYADGESFHLQYGRMLAQRAELEYIQVLEKLAADAHTNPFTNEYNIMGRLATDVIEGRMDIEEFQQKLKEYEKDINEQVEKAHNNISLGFNAAGKYDGTNDEILFYGISEFRQAENQLAQALVNLYNPHELKSIL